MGLWDFLEDAVDAIGDAVSDVVEDVADAAEDAVDAVVDAAEDAAEWVSDAAEDVADAVGDAADVVAGAIADAVGEAVDFLEDTAEDVVQAIESAAEAAAEWVRNTANAIADWVVQAASDAWQWVTNVAQDIWQAGLDAALWISETAEAAWAWIREHCENVEECLSSMLWAITQLPDLILALSFGLICTLFGVEEESYFELRRICDDTLPQGAGANNGGLIVARAPADRRYVVFSDHHMYYAGSDLDKFRIFRNHELYAMALAEYAREDQPGGAYTLIENGDVEDLVVTEPTLEGVIVDEWFDAMGGVLGETFDALYERGARRTQLGRVMRNNAELYPQIRADFHDPGRLIRTAGNHDMELLHGEFLEDLRTEYPEIVVNDYVLIVPVDAGGNEGYPLVAIAHGHQFDAWTNPVCGPMVGEVITESFSWASEGADRTWSYDDESLPRLQNSSVAGGNGFANELVSLWGLGTGLISVSEELKPRHVDELELQRIMRNAFWNAESQPHLIIGHTHEPRSLARDDQGTPWDGYSNTASAGRYERLLWCVEIEDGTPELFAWRWNEAGTGAEKLRMIVASDGTLVPEAA